MADTGALVVCPTPIGNLGDVTLRALEELRRADAAACEDTRHSRTLLARHGIDLPLIALHEHNERAQSPAIVRRVAAGDRICLLTDAGFPAVSDPGALLIAAALDAGIRPVVLPGASAVPVALAASGMAGGGYVFAGFLPRAAGALATLLDHLDGARLPIVAFESPKRLPSTLARLAGRDPERTAAVCRELTKLHEQVERGTIAELAASFEQPPKGEVTLVLAAAQERPSDLPDAAVLSELAGALGSKRAAALASTLSGVPRNQIYEALTRRR